MSYNLHFFLKYFLLKCFHQGYGIMIFKKIVSLLISLLIFRVDYLYFYQTIWGVLGVHGLRFYFRVEGLPLNRDIKHNSAVIENRRKV